MKRPSGENDAEETQLLCSESVMYFLAPLLQSTVVGTSAGGTVGVSAFLSSISRSDWMFFVISTDFVTVSYPASEIVTVYLPGVRLRGLEVEASAPQLKDFPAKPAETTIASLDVIFTLAPPGVVFTVSWPKTRVSVTETGVAALVLIVTL